MASPGPTGLPVEDSVTALQAALQERGTAVLVAPPGAGKTTVVPLRLLAEPWIATHRIVVLEPRRLAARAAARRMADLVGEDVGGTVGYVTRDERRTSARTRVEVVTEGVLTRRLQRDADLPGTGLVVFDEIHERNLQSDLGLALTLDLRRHLRPDLRLLAMSATLDVPRVAALLGDARGPATVVTSEARAHPVAIRWAPPRPKERVEAATAEAVRRALRDEPGDVLVFLPGAGEIHRVASLLDRPAAGSPHLDGVDVRPLYGALSWADQDAALAPAPPGRRRVVLATDIAETSLTVEGVRVVVDAGLARVPRFDPRTGMTRLRTVPASRSSADQRAGRAGRTEPGTAYRLWSKLEHGARRAYLEPEITQVDLAGLALELAAWGTVDGADLPFPDPPPAGTLAEGRRLLALLGAVDLAGHLTPTGRAMADLPLHPRLARMVVDAAAGGDGGVACLLAALLDERDVLRGRPEDLPADLGLRLALLAFPSADHPAADRRALAAARRRAQDLARRAGLDPGPLDAVDPDHVGRVLALAYPDRLAVRRGSPGRFQLRTGTTAWVPREDLLADDRFLVAADLDGKRADARIRLAAALAPDAVAERFADAIDEVRTLTWDRGRDELVERVERRIGGVVLDERSSRPMPGPAVVEALVARVRADGLALLGGTTEAGALRDRVAFARRVEGERWPDWSDAALLATADEWLAPLLASATGRDALSGVDLRTTLQTRLPHGARRGPDAVAPTHLALPGGRHAPVDYAADPPVLAVKVQDVFGLTATPTVGRGTVPVLLHLLSPAGRPVQITQDLAGFWSGSWRQVRAEMAGRYPKHPWPLDPTRPA